MSVFEGSRAGMGDLSPDDDDAHRVMYELVCSDFPDELDVRSFDAVEALNQPYVLTVGVEARSEITDLGELLGRDVFFELHRPDHGRTFAGIVRRTRVDGMGRWGPLGTIEIVPALWALRHTEDSRIFQEKSALEIVELVLTEGLERYGRRLDATSLQRDRYLARDYCVQYRESSFDFVHRLLEEEGIGYCFRQADDDPETLVLFDDNSDLGRVQTMNQGPVGFDPTIRAWAGFEPVLQFGVATELTSSRLSVREHDWTRGRPTLERSTDDGPTVGRHSHEVYEHGFDRHLSTREDNEVLGTLVDLAVGAAMPFGPPPGLEHMVHDLPGMMLDSFTSSDLGHQVAIRRERHRRDALTCRGVGVVTDFSPGRVFELVGHPTPGANGEYLLTKVVHTSAPKVAASEGEGPTTHNYESSFECLPLTTPWRPDRRARKPRIYGVQTARVTGPAGMDVHTDSHGRIKVRFPWDRAPDDISGNHTCWLRVSQAWAGHGAPGFMFIPRVGMEVIVSFVDGDPDRPLVTGCVYNGANPTPGMLPVQATKSIIRTRTVPHGPGHNELSFEDAMGMERVHIRAQRDLDELVLNNHVTTVHRHQSNSVGGDQDEKVARHQRVSVKGNRAVQVGGKLTEYSGSDYLRSVSGTGTEQYGGSYELSVEGGSASTNVLSGEFVASAKGGIGLIQNQERMIKLASEGEEAGILINSKGAVIHVSENKILLKVGRSSITIEDGHIQANHKTLPA